MIFTVSWSRRTLCFATGNCEGSVYPDRTGPFSGGDRDGDWLKRTAGARAGIYGNDAVEAMYPMSKTRANGEALDGGKANYTLTFAAGQ